MLSSAVMKPGFANPISLACKMTALPNVPQLNFLHEREMSHVAETWSENP